MNNFDEKLLEAAGRQNGYDEVKDLIIEKKANVNKRDESGSTPLINACFFGKTDVVKLLLENGADSNLSNNVGNSPLHWTAIAANERNSKECLDIMNILLEFNADIDAKNETGSTSLMQCVRDFCVFDFLIQRGANVNIRDEQGRNVLFLATTMHRCVKSVNHLIKFNADRTILAGEYEASELMWAANEGLLDIAVVLLTTLTNEDEKEIRKNFDKMMSLRFGRNPFPKDIRKLVNKVFIRTLSLKYMARANFLLNQVNKDNRTPYDIAVIKNHADMIKLLHNKNDIFAKIISNVKNCLFSKIIRN